MKKSVSLSIFGWVILSVNFAFAENLIQTNANPLCFGSQAWGSNGEYSNCIDTANNINSLSTGALKVSARCEDVRNNLQARIDSGCLTAAFVVSTTVITDTAEVTKENNTITRACERSGWSDGNQWRDSCLNGSDPRAADAKACAIQSTIQACKDRGFASCSNSNMEITFQYYFWGEPRCIARAKVSN